MVEKNPQKQQGENKVLVHDRIRLRERSIALPPSCSLRGIAKEKRCGVKVVYGLFKGQASIKASCKRCGYETPKSQQVNSLRNEIPFERLAEIESQPTLW